MVSSFPFQTLFEGQVGVKAQLGVPFPSSVAGVSHCRCSLFLRDTDALRTLLSHHGAFLKQQHVQLPERVAEMFEQLLPLPEEEQDSQVSTGTSPRLNQGHWRLREKCPVLHPTEKGLFEVPHPSCQSGTGTSSAANHHKASIFVFLCDFLS